MQVGIIGVGLIGGSMAVDLKNRGFADRVVGVEADALHASAAKELGLVDEIVSYEECIAMSDMIVVAVPVSIAIRMIPDILDKVDRQVVTDVCSTKEKINDMVRYHPNRKNFVAAHPMAGTEYSGPWAALPGLFDGRAGIICNAEDSDMQAVELVKQMYDCLNMRVIYMRALRYDHETGQFTQTAQFLSRTWDEPRHAAVHPNNRWVYMCEEKGNKVLFFRFDDENGTFEALQELTTVPETVTGYSDASEVMVDPSGKFVLVSNRYTDSIAVYRIDPLTGYMRNVGFYPCLGKTPRFFCFGDNGKCYVANEDSDTIIEFDFDNMTGALIPTLNIVHTGSPVCILFAD